MFKLDKRLVSRVLLLVMLLTPLVNVFGVEASSQKGSFRLYEHTVNYDLGEDLSTVKYGVDDFDISLLEGEITQSKLNQVRSEYKRIAGQVVKSKHKAELEDKYIGLMNNVIAKNLKHVGNVSYLDPKASLQYAVYANLRDNVVYSKPEITGTHYTKRTYNGSFKGFTDPSQYKEYEELFVKTIKAMDREINFKNEKPFVVLIPIEDKSFGGSATLVDGYKGSEAYITCTSNKDRFVHSVAHEMGHIVSTEFAGDSGVKGTGRAMLVGLRGRLPVLNQTSSQVEKNFADIYNAHASQTSFDGYKAFPVGDLKKIESGLGIFGYGNNGAWETMPREHVAESIGVYFADKVTGKDTPIYTGYGKNNEAVAEFIKLRGKVSNKYTTSLEVQELTNSGSSVKFKVKAKGGVLVGKPVQEHVLGTGQSVTLKYIDSKGKVQTGVIKAVKNGGRLVLTSSPSNLFEGVGGGSTVGTDEGEDVNKEDGNEVEVGGKDKEDNIVDTGKDKEDNIVDTGKDKEDKEDNDDFVIEPVDLGKYFRANGLDVGEVDGYIQGFTDNTFRPFKTLTRGELAQMLNNIYRQDILGSLKINKRVDVMKDVKPNHWYYTPVIRMKKLGIITGYTDNTFRQTREVSRIEFAKILYELAGDGVKEVDTSKVKINDSVKWGEEYLKVAVAQGWLELDAAGNVNPHGTITRIEVITVLNDILEIGERDNVKIRFNDLVGLSEDVYKNIYKSVIRK